MVSLALGSVITPVAAHTEDSPFVTDLIAGGGNPKSAIDVGDVFVWNDGEYLFVKYVTIDGWCLIETHLEIKTSLDLIPQTKNGNPIPGHFSYHTKHECIPEFEYVIPLDGWTIGTNLFIAAHAVVADTNTPYEVVFVSEPGMDVYGPITAYTPLGDDSWGEPGASVATWEPTTWPSIQGATWISTAYYVENPVIDSWRWFRRMFYLCDNYYYKCGSVLLATSDNAEECYYDEILIGSDGEVQGPFIDNHEWNTIVEYNFNPHPGINTLDFIVRNYYQAGGTIESNPTGLIYKAAICYYMLETAWADGLDFPGKNWATYFTYTIQSAETYFIEYPETGFVYIGYEDNPSGDFDYNDFGMTFSFEEVYDQEWNLMRITMEFTAVIYDSGMDHLIHIERPIIGESTVIIERINHIPSPVPILDKNETPEGTYLFDGNVDIILFNTYKYTHPQKQIGEKVQIEIIVHDPLSNPKNPDLLPPRVFLNQALEPFYDMDSIMANYDPWEEGSLYGSLFHIHNIQSTYKFGSPSIFVPYILVVPFTDWIPPYEQTTITSPYGYFDNFYRYGTPMNWYDPSMVTANYVGSGGLSWGPYP